MTAKKSIAKNHFLFDPILRSCLIALQKTNLEISSSKRLVFVEDLKRYDLSEFIMEQKDWIDKIQAGTLRDWEVQSGESIKKASYQSLTEKGFTITLISESIIGAVEKKLTFTEQSARKSECRRLQRFVKLCDHMLGTTLQMLVIQTAQDLLGLAFKGCSDKDVMVDDSGSGTVLLDENGRVQSLPSKLSKDGPPSDSTPTQNTTLGVQVGGSIVGSEVGTDRLIKCGFDGFSDILCRLLMERVPQLVLTDVIEDKSVGTDEEVVAVIPVNAKGGFSKLQKNEHSQFSPLFKTELLIKKDGSNHFYFSPGLQEYLQTMDGLIKIYLSTAEKFQPFTNSIPFLNPANLTGGAYSSMRGLDENDFGECMQIGSIIDSSAYFQEICGRIRGVMVGIFSNATDWMDSLSSLRQMWIDNEYFEVTNALRLATNEVCYLLATSSQDSSEGGATSILTNFRAQKYEKKLETKGIPVPKTDSILRFAADFVSDDSGVKYSPLVKFFEESLSKFTMQKQAMNAIPVRYVVNNISIDTSYLKSVLEPSPERCFNQVASIFPSLARDKNELLLTETQKWVFMLTSKPNTVEGFVESLGWLETGKLVFYSSFGEYGHRRVAAE